ncbi:MULTISPECIES: FKBP-type peptidyl-prolyl cis-trans isomerase [unclassified Luteimonas]|uniref:FKBP-type peptidyl-prolyl cis-trans isomerase n=1 Tax=unclassified Luteimonas TaxID=2629088 RepID=UPI0015FFF0F8|nr:MULTISPECIES: FKBP-type peptidyl-prolyl cis-trans isomerase [unclassified Luteimonas]MBB1471891.1 FKBP-type peptidyl-prolyl cis-trans isomerase [Luteimonas sp. MC1782]MBB6599380.1 FKBP-type peptidyl-prolyl cis-trans isomerase [Luteimonas sp. MC1825]QOC87091.1 FKBP-type peptidyl-prolyl cis-trans isomerase [Luteimonas sp. MC1825]
MNSMLRGLAALSIAAALSHAPAHAQEKTVPSTEREKNSYLIGMDVGRSIEQVGPDLDRAAFRRAIDNAFAGGKPLVTEAEAAEIGPALMQRVAVRSGQPLQGVAPGTEPPKVAKDKVGLLVGADVGRSLAPIKDEVDMAMFEQGLAVTLDRGTPVIPDAEQAVLREAFGKRMQERMRLETEAAAQKGAAEGVAFLATNKAAKGVVSTASGLQYMVLRQGAGQRPMADSRVRVHYQGTLLDGTVFDSSYERNDPATFGLNQVIAGWTEGLQLMPVGAKYRFWIPAELAYGRNGSPGSIPPNSALVFDVELLQVL